MSQEDAVLNAALAEAREAEAAGLGAGERDGSSQTFKVDIDGYEGPLHVLLALAREQKVDLRRLSILKLSEQYLAFMSQARATRIDLAADYLVMAAWLAYLKSRLLLPRKERSRDEPAPDDLASHLAWRLRRLDAMRTAADALYDRPQTGLDIFPRGAPEETAVTEIPLWDADLLDLLRAYASQRTRSNVAVHAVKPWPVYPIEDARRRLETLLPDVEEWRALGAFAPEADGFSGSPPSAASRYASLMSASLELAKTGKVDLQQLHADDLIYIKSRSPREDMR
jgi:segregation and condensation protein A